MAYTVASVEALQRLLNDVMATANDTGITGDEYASFLITECCIVAQSLDMSYAEALAAFQLAWRTCIESREYMRAFGITAIAAELGIDPNRKKS